MPELRLDVPGDLSGWVFVEARVDPRYHRCRSSLEVIPPSGTAGGKTIPVAIRYDGKLVEVVHLPAGSRLTWHAPAGGKFDASQFKLAKAGWLARTCNMIGRVAWTWLWTPGRMKMDSGLSLRRILFDLPNAYRLATRFEAYYPWTEYADWVERFDRLETRDVQQIENHARVLTTRRRFHVLIGTDQAAAEAVEATLASLKTQIYREFDHALVSGDAAVEPKPDAWLILMRAGDTLAPHALYWLACAILANPGTDVVYSDDDAVDAQGQRQDPRFKPDWSPAHLRSTHYIGSAAALRGSAVAGAGGITPETVRHGNYDLLLRVNAGASVEPVHIPAVLYHRGSELPGTGDRAQGSGYPDAASPAASYKPQATSHQPRATNHPAWENPEWCMGKLREHLARIGSPGEVVPTLPGCWRVRYRLPETPPLISIIVPTRDAVALLRQCVESILKKTTYPRYELLIVDNQSIENVTISFLKEISSDPHVRVLRYDQPFNYSAINNFAAREAHGEMLCLLNNDTQVISADWLEEMTGHLFQKGVGAVGARLLYPDGRVQHAGVTVGPGGGADHLHGHVAREEAGYCNRAVLTQEFSAVTAACMLTWKHLYERLGGLNEKDLSVAFNDVDYCLRLQEAGYRVVYSAGAELFHHESATRGREETWSKRRRAKREVRYLTSRWAARLEHDPYYNPNFSYRQPDFSLATDFRDSKPWEESGAQGSGNKIQGTS